MLVVTQPVAEEKDGRPPHPQPTSLLATMAPNVGQPDSLYNEELVQEDIGYASASRPFSLELSTPGELGLGTCNQVRSGSGAETEVYFVSDVPRHTPKDVTFRDASRKSRSSADSFYEDPTPLTETRHSGWAPSQFGPATFGGARPTWPSHFRRSPATFRQRRSQRQ